MKKLVLCAALVSACAAPTLIGSLASRKECLVLEEGTALVGPPALQALEESIRPYEVLVCVEPLDGGVP